MAISAFKSRRFNVFLLAMYNIRQQQRVSSAVDHAVKIMIPLGVVRRTYGNMGSIEYSCGIKPCQHPNSVPKTTPNLNPNSNQTPTTIPSIFCIPRLPEPWHAQMALLGFRTTHRVRIRDRVRVTMRAS